MATTGWLRGRRRGPRTAAAGLLGASALVVTALAIPAAAHSIGVYPTQLAFENALRGGSYQQTIGILDDSPTPETFQLQITGEIAAWTTFRDAKDPSKVITSVQAQAGPPTQVLLQVVVPAQAGDSLYQGVVHATPELKATTPGHQSGQSVSISDQIPVGVQVTGTQVIAGALLDGYTYPAIEVGSPLRFFSVLENTGNVEVHPSIHLVISRGGSVMFDRVFSNEPVDPGVASKAVESDWTDTTAAPVGSYDAHVDVSYVGKAIGSKDARFTVVPYGALRRQGSLDALTLQNRPQPGQAALVAAVVHNTGQIETRPVFHGELYLGGKLISGVTSVPMLTLPGQTGTISMVISALAHGHYTLRGQANFDGTESNTRALQFQVGKGAGATILPWLLGGLLLLLLAAVFWWITSRRRSPRHRGGRSEKAAAAPEPAVARLPVAAGVSHATSASVPSGSGHRQRPEQRPARLHARRPSASDPMPRPARDVPT